MNDDAKTLTLREAQEKQPWTVPYSDGLERAAKNDLPQVYGSHCVLHAMKSLGKIAAVCEWRDHNDFDAYAWAGLRIEHKNQIRAAAADLVTAAIRFANLEGFDLASALIERVVEKNGKSFRFPEEKPPAGHHAPAPEESEGT